jgi:hypothetical protein
MNGRGEDLLSSNGGLNGSHLERVSPSDGFVSLNLEPSSAPVPSRCATEGRVGPPARGWQLGCRRPVVGSSAAVASSAVGASVRRWRMLSLPRSSP